MTNVVDCSVTIYSPRLIELAGVKFVGLIRCPDQELLLHSWLRPRLIFNFTNVIRLSACSRSFTEPQRASLFPVHKPASTQMLSRRSLDKPAQ
jgi:hypothetical protein